MRHWGEEGFTMIEVLVVCTMLGILAAVAVPKFTNSVALANTAKIQADLETIDTAVALYWMDMGTYPEKVTALGDYITDVEKLKPPTGKCRTKDGTEEITAKEYTLVPEAEGKGKEVRAHCGSWKSSDFVK